VNIKLHFNYLTKADNRVWSTDIFNSYFILGHNKNKLHLTDFINKLVYSNVHHNIIMIRHAAILLMHLEPIAIDI